jgi:hypothetical protein
VLSGSQVAFFQWLLVPSVILAPPKKVTLGIWSVFGIKAEINLIIDFFNNKPVKQFEKASALGQEVFIYL